MLVPAKFNTPAAAVTTTPEAAKIAAACAVTKLEAVVVKSVAKVAK